MYTADPWLVQLRPDRPRSQPQTDPEHHSHPLQKRNQQSQDQPCLDQAEQLWQHVTAWNLQGIVPWCETTVHHEALEEFAQVVYQGE